MDESCAHCGHIKKPSAVSAQSTLVFALTALIFYIPANLFPFMTMELYGKKTTATIWSGIVTLAESGSWLIAFVVFAASMLIPFLKLVILVYLSIGAKNPDQAIFNTRLYRFVEAIGRWSMLDIFLLAILVAIMKLGHWTSVQPGLAAPLFVLVVIFTMLASHQFDPQLLRKAKND